MCVMSQPVFLEVSTDRMLEASERKFEWAHPPEVLCFKSFHSSVQHFLSLHQECFLWYISSALRDPGFQPLPSWSNFADPDCVYGIESHCIIKRLPPFHQRFIPPLYLRLDNTKPRPFLTAQVSYQLIELGCNCIPFLMQIRQLKV